MDKGSTRCSPPRRGGGKRFFARVAGNEPDSHSNLSRNARPVGAAPATLPTEASVRRVDAWSPAFWRHLYTEVGRAYRWVDRLVWTDDEINAYLSDPAIQLWVLTVGSETAGYFELRRYPDQSIEIAYFGLLPVFVGHGLGKGLLTSAAAEAWRAGARACGCTPRHWTIRQRYRTIWRAGSRCSRQKSTSAAVIA